MTAADQSVTPARVRRQLARRLYDHLTDGAFDDARDMCHPKVRNAVPAAHLRRKWADLGPGPSTFVDCRAVEGTKAELRFERDGTTFRIDLSIGDDRTIHGIFFRPASNDRPDAYSRPAYVDTGVHSHELAVESRDRTIYGELVTPLDGERARPIVFIPGTGAAGGDGAVGSARPFRDLAYGLASAGFATIRYNKPPVTDGDTLETSYVADAGAFVDRAASMDRIADASPVVLGHSLGGFVAPLVCERRSLPAAIVLGAPCGDLATVAIEQAGADVRAETFQELLDEVDEDRHLFGFPASFWRDVDGMRPAEVAADEGIDVFVGYGARDELVPRAAFDRWNAVVGSDRATARYYRTLDHALLPAADDPGTEPHVPRWVIDDVAAWLSGRATT